MKLRLFSLLLSSACIVSSLQVSQAADPGGIVFVGDSITQGVKGVDNLPHASYRYQLFKNFVDNGIRYNPMGTTQGAAKGLDVSALTPNYRGQQFNNTSEAAASGRAYQYSGHEANASLRGDPGTVFPAANRGPVSVKLGLVNPYTGDNHSYYNGNTLTQYTGDTYQSLYGSEKPSTICIMIGVNDLYDSTTGFTTSREATIESTRQIVQAYQAYNPNVNVVVMGILPVGSNNGSYSYVNDYNKQLAAETSKWSTGSSNVQYADVSKGFYAKNGAMIDTASGAHPNTQGELIVAGNIARVLGVGQRTMGLERKAASALQSQVNISSPLQGSKGLEVVTTTSSGSQTKSNFTLGAGACTWTNSDSVLHIQGAAGATPGDMRMVWPETTTGTAHDFTLSLTIQMNHGLVDASKNIFSIFCGNGADQVGILRIGEAGIFWQESNGSQTLLYGGIDTATDPLLMVGGYNDITVIFRNGAGFCVWLNDQLIAEDRMGSTNSGIVNAYKNHILFGKTAKNDSIDANISAMAFDPNTAFAPIPEPCTAFMGLIGICGLALRRRVSSC